MLKNGDDSLGMPNLCRRARHNRFASTDVGVTNASRSRQFSFKILFWLLVLILIPCGFQFREKINMVEIGRKFNFMSNQENLLYLRNTWEQTVSLARYLVKEFTPRGDLVEQIKKKSEDITEITSSYLKDLVAFYCKPDLSSIFNFFFYSF